MIQKCPRCGGEAGAHYAACTFANMIQRWLGDDYPLFGPPQPTPGALEAREIEEITHAVTEPLRRQIEEMRKELDAAIDAITKPHPPTPEPAPAAPVDVERLAAIIPRPLPAEQNAEIQPAPEPPPADQAEWKDRIPKIRHDRNWTQAQLARRIGCARSLVGFWETGKNQPGPRYRQALTDLEQGIEPPNAEKKKLPSGLVAANAAAREQATKTVKTVIDRHTTPAASGWVPSTELLELTQRIDPKMTSRMLGMGMRDLGYPRRQVRKADGSAPVNYGGLALAQKEQEIPKPMPEPPLDEQMAQRRAAEEAARATLPPPPPKKERYRYDGPRPGGEVPAEYRTMLDPLWSVPGWSYAPSNANGGGKPRVTNPQGTSYVIPNTPSDVRAVKNTRAALRRLGAPL